MVQLEKISAGDSVLGIDAQEPVTIVAVQWYGNAVLNITYKNAKGELGSRLLYREDEAALTLQEAHLP